MGEMSQRDGLFLVDVRDEGTLVVEAEGEDAVAVWGLEGGVVDSRGGGGLVEVEAVVGVEHGEFELDFVVGGGDIGDPADGCVFVEGDGVFLIQ